MMDNQFFISCFNAKKDTNKIIEIINDNNERNVLNIVYSKIQQDSENILYCLFKKAILIGSKSLISRIEQIITDEYIFDKLFIDSVTNNQIETITYLKKKRDFSALAKKHSSYKDSRGRNILKIACDNANEELATYFISLGLNCTDCDNDLSTPLHSIAKHNLIKVFLENQRGWKLNEKDNKGDTPLHIGCKYNSVDVVEALIRSGASIDLVNNKKETPIFIASKKDYIDIVFTLYEKGADVRTKSFVGLNAIEIAQKRKSKLVSIFYSDIKNVNKTPLIYAIEKGDKEMIGILLSRGTDIMV